MAASHATTPAGQPQMRGDQAVIPVSHPCGRCGYNLMGLPDGGNCPECGTPIRARVSAQKRDVLGDAPAGYLLGLMLGLACSGLAGLGLIGLNFLTSLAQLGWPAAARNTVLFTLASMWFGGIVLVLRQRPGTGAAREIDERGLEWFRLRLFVGATQLGVLGYVFADVSYSRVAGALPPNPMAGVWFVVGLLSLIVAVTGWPALCFYMARLTDWAPDDSLTGQWRATGSFIGFGALATVIGLVASTLGTALKFIAVIGGVLCLSLPLASVYMMALLVGTSGMVLLAMWNAHGRRARDARMAERALRLADEMASRSAGGANAPRPPAAEIDLSVLRAVEEVNRQTDDAELAAQHEAQRQAAMRQGCTLARTSDGQGYKLEGE